MQTPCRRRGTESAAAIDSCSQRQHEPKLVRQAVETPTETPHHGNQRKLGCARPIALADPPLRRGIGCAWL
jgi:hypothetical protein